MTGRIAARFAVLASKRRKGLIAFIMGGDPTPKECTAFLAKLPEAGADLIEIGIPFSDPMADGAIIQAAGKRALQGGTTLGTVLDLVRGFRARDAQTPLVLMGYYNPVYRYGPEPFCKDAREAGADGVILVDLPLEEEEEFGSPARAHDLNLVRLVAPTTGPARLARMVEGASGFLYYVAVTGVTGVKSTTAAAVAAELTPLRRLTSLPIAVGFGIKTAAQARELAAHCDGVVVGSAIVDMLHRQSPEAAIALVQSLRAGLDEI